MELQDEDGHPHPSIERRTVRKLDLILLPFLSLLFLVNSLDRSNIGNAETANFTRDAGLQPEDLNAAVAWFFVFFVALQPLGAAAGRKFGMSKWVPSVMTLWGVCTVLHVWVRKRWQLILLRIVIGTLESGFYPTAVSYLSLFYTRYEFGRRLGLFYGSYGIAGALGGIIAFAVFSKFPSDDGKSTDGSAAADGWKSWQILFLIEGLLTIVIALVGFFWLPHSAGTAWFLSPEERKCAEQRVLADRSGDGATKGPGDILPAEELSEDAASHSEQDEQRRRLLSDEPPLARIRSTSEPSALTSDAGLTRQEILSTVLFFPLIVPILILNIASAIPSTAFSVFLPLVLSSLKLSSPVHSNILTAPPFLLASITLYMFTHWSDKSRQRIIPILASLGIIMLGLVLTLLLSSSSISSGRAIALYISLCILLGGSFIPSPLTVAWYAGNIPDPGKRAIVLGINGYGNLAGVFAALIFPPRWQEDGYRPSFLITLGFVVVSSIGYMALRTVLLLINKARVKTAARLAAMDVDGEQIPVNSGIRIPAFAVVGGKWWDTQVRYWFGKRLLRMDGNEIYVRQGDEVLTFEYGL
ncbi:hypothetical protein AJ80_03571 [Polytolypa hystricis UAMH7299]|uniref:Major facilitator superfamily (MFS) profile domain-containing protein n=1 Tax=Polytolypa hystricis (strain UAMH7299) TaxID=1447883 RepID=A0A2B7YFX7_POLH7|nr:hypothetical protein AJ80_03571 [Polytolypa hystricis UAMH7299]